MKHSHKKNKKGFTLIETMVAITILVLATLGPLAVSSQGLTQAEFARDQVTAYYLADEPIEYIRNVTDTNTIQGLSWTAGPTLPDCMNGNACMIDATDNNSSTAITQCTNPTSCTPLDTDSTGTFYYNTSPNRLGNRGKPSIFTRTVTMTPVVTSVSGDEYQIKSTVSWKTGGIAKTFTVVENINNSNKTS